MMNLDLTTFQHDLSSMKKITKDGNIGLVEKEREALLVVLDRVEMFYHLMLSAKNEYTNKQFSFLDQQK